MRLAIAKRPGQAAVQRQAQMRLLPVQDRDLQMTEDESKALTRPQRRFLRRIFNGRTVPLVAADRSFLTYKDASRYLESLTSEARDAAYADIRGSWLAASLKVD